MARVTAISLRDRARAAMLSAGGRGFVRFPERGALLVSDAIRRCENEAARNRLLDALAQAGFRCQERDGLLQMDPSDAMLAAITYEGGVSICWDGPLCGAQTLAARWLSREKRPITPAGRRLIIDTLRLTWQDRAVDGLAALRAQAAVMQREKDTGGLWTAGAVLANWCDMQEGKDHED